MTRACLIVASLWMLMSSPPATAGTFNHIDGDIWLMVPDSESMARRDQGDFPIDMALLFGVDVGRRVCEELAIRAKGQLASKSIVAESVCERWVQETPTSWVLGVQASQEVTMVTVASGQYWAVRVHVVDPEAVIRSQMGRAAAAAARRLHVNMAGRVNLELSSRILDACWSNGSDILMYLSDAH